MAIILELKIIISERTLRKKISKNLKELKSTPKGLLQAECVMSRVPLWKFICSVGCSILGTHDLVSPVTASCLCWQGPELGELVSPLLWSSPGVTREPCISVVETGCLFPRCSSPASECWCGVPQLLCSCCPWALCSVGHLDLHFRCDQLNCYPANCPQT